MMVNKNLKATWLNYLQVLHFALFFNIYKKKCAVLYIQDIPFSQTLNRLKRMSMNRQDKPE